MSSFTIVNSQIGNTERETTRKKYVASLESRTSEQIAEEEALYIEIKRLEQNERRFKRDRDELLRTLLGVDSGLPEVINMVDDEGPMGGISENGNKRKRRGTLDTPMTPSSVIALGPPVPRRAQSAKSVAYGMRAFFVCCDECSQFLYRCAELYSTDGPSSNDNDSYKSSTPSDLPSDFQVTHSQSSSIPESRTKFSGTRD